MGNVWVFQSIPQGKGKCSKTHLMGRAGKLVSTLFPKYGCFHGILWHTSSHGKYMGIPTKSDGIGIRSKTHPMWRAREIDSHTFSKVWVVLFHQFSSYGMHYHMGKAWVFPSISHSMRKRSEAHLMINPSKICSYEKNLKYL